MSDIVHRVCKKCTVSYPLTSEFFSKLKHNLDGFHTRCKKCNNQSSKEYYLQNVEAINARKRAYNASHHGMKTRPAKDRSIEDIRTASEKRKEYYQKNKQRILANCKAYRERNPEKVRLMLRECRHRRRAIEHSAEGSHTKEDILLQYKSQKGKCWWCGIELNDVYHVDHLVPLSRGGTDNPNNLVVTCQFCNLSKKDKLPQDWAKRLF